MSHRTVGMKQHSETPKTLNLASKRTLIPFVYQILLNFCCQNTKPHNYVLSQHNTLFYFLLFYFVLTGVKYASLSLHRESHLGGSFANVSACFQITTKTS